MPSAEASPGSLRDPPDPTGAGARERLDRGFFARPSLEVAPSLLGLILLRSTPEGICAGRIVETEAYAGPDDRASHARAGRTARTATMFGPPGRAYVYLVYGLHHCLNVVCEEDGLAGAVLVRAIEPLVGIELMTRRRGRADTTPERLAAGPARLCQALAVDRTLDGEDLVVGARLWLAREARGAGGRTASMPPSGIATEHELRVVRGPRIGVDYAGPEWASRPWRFGLRGHASLSRPFPAADEP